MSEYWRQRFIDAAGQYEYPVEYHELQDHIDYLDSQHNSFIECDCIPIRDYSDTSDLIFVRGGQMTQYYKDNYGFTDDHKFIFYVFSISTGWRRLLWPFEYEKFGFNPITGGSDWTPFIYANGDPKYVNLKRRYEFVRSDYFQQYTDKRQALQVSMQSIEKISLRKIVYDEYIASKEWREKSQSIKRRDGYRCYNCHSQTQLHVHHWHYERAGDEWPIDLITVCHNCHNRIHNIKGAWNEL